MFGIAYRQLKAEFEGLARILTDVENDLVMANAKLETALAANKKLHSELTEAQCVINDLENENDVLKNDVKLSGKILTEMKYWLDAEESRRIVDFHKEGDYEI